MIRYFGARLLALAFCLSLALPLDASAAATVATAAAEKPESKALAASGTNAFSLHPGREDGRIAYVVARLLERMQYLRHPFDDTISSEFLSRYLDTLDSQHSIFLQSDVDQFEARYGTNLDNLTLTRRGIANVSPAYAVFARFVERLQQRVAYVDDLLKHEKFEFDTNERIVIDRHDSPYPEDLAAAKKLWNRRLRYEYLQEKLGLEDPRNAKAASTNTVESIHRQIVEKLAHRYQRRLRLFSDWDNEDVMGVYLTALAHVYDPHSDYFNAAQLQSFSIAMNLQLFGIGAELVSDDGYCKIVRLLPGGPAIKSRKIKEGDRIVAVAQGDQTPVDVVDMSLSKIVQMIRGPKGTEVRLTLIPAGDPSARRVVSLVRAEIPLDDQAAKGKIIQLPDDQGKMVRLGVIDLPSFYAAMSLPGGQPEGTNGDSGDQSPRSTSADVAKLLTKFKQEHVRGVILDLRRNGGGSLEEAIKLTGLFIKRGPVVQVRAPDGSVYVESDNDPSELYQGPLIVLTSRFSASASEIVAGALQDYGRAIIVGDSSTHGKGTVQNLNSLRPFMPEEDSDTNNPGALKVTIRKFYRVTGASTQLKGVLPDIVLPSVLNYAKDIGESSLDDPLPWDRIRSVPFHKLDLVQPYLPELLKLSNERVATNQDFVYIRQDIAQFRKRQAEKTVSLNEKHELEQVREAEAREKARDKERLARKEPDEAIYDISLKQAGLPGLPPPEGATNSLATATPPGAGAAATNSASLSGVESPHASVLGDSADDLDKAPAVDADLNESEHIMLDYISLLEKGNPLVVDH